MANSTLSNQAEANQKDNTKSFTIIVNGREKIVTSRELSFSEIVALAFDNPPSEPNTIFTVTYRRGEGNKPEGSLVQGETVKIKDGMIFNVTATDKS
jgi:hypothetical protein